MTIPQTQHRSVDELVSAARGGRIRAVGRLISAVENQSWALPIIIEAIAADVGRAYVIGLTGAPGVGKSTTTSMLVRALRAAGRKVAVLAIDPSSPFSGGALLGDRIRMTEHALDTGVYIRSMATRGHLGGLAVAVPQALRVLDAAGFEIVIVETVGVGQSEVDIARVADLTAVLVAPGMGDGIQAAKAGLLEIGDLYVVNKSDRDGTQTLIRDLRGMIALGVHDPEMWKPRIVSIIATEQVGSADLIGAIDSFRDHQSRTGQGQRRRVSRARREIESLALATVRASLPTTGSDGLGDLAEAVAEGTLDPYAAARRLLAQ